MLHYFEGLKASLERLQLEYVDVVFANRPDANTPMEGKHACMLGFCTIQPICMLGFLQNLLLFTCCMATTAFSPLNLIYGPHIFSHWCHNYFFNSKPFLPIL